MKVMAFLQNAWARDPQKMQAIMDRHDDDLDFRADLTGRYLALSFTGKRLIRTLGTHWFNDIIWEECTKVIAGESKSCPPPDHAHIFRVLDHHKPSVVIAFGNVAQEAVFDKFDGWKIAMPHPAARQSDVPTKLQECGKFLTSMKESYPKFLAALSTHEMPFPETESAGLLQMQAKMFSLITKHPTLKMKHDL